MDLYNWLGRVMRSLRQKGQTTTALGTLLQNKNAVLVVGRYSMKRLLQGDYPMLKNRILTVDELVKTTFAIDATHVLVWDNTAVEEIYGTVFKEGRKLGQEEGLALSTSMTIQEREKPTPTVDTDTMNQLAKVLNEIGKMYNVNILVVPKPKE